MRMITTIQGNDTFIESISDTLINLIRMNDTKSTIRITKKIEGLVELETKGKEIEKAYQKVKSAMRGKRTILRLMGIKFDVRLEDDI